ncbi:MAG: hypothetical protein RLZZ342_129 [Candidatus Parcubacteria bacterium]
MWITCCRILHTCHNRPMHKTLTVVAGIIATLPLVASAQTSADLQTQIEALLLQVQQLQSQLGGQGGGTTSVAPAAQGVAGLAQQAGVQVVDSSACPQIGRSLKLGSSGDDVTRLQHFLARDKSVYPEGTVTGYYGALTEAAVRRWQTKFNIVSQGSPEATGYGVVGPRTAAAISLQCSLYSGSGGGTNGGGGDTVGGYIQVSPIAGNAPLQVNVQATVNTTNSCAGAIYALSWGDGTAPQQIPVSANNCNQLSQTYSHTYQYGGTYQIVLAAGSHRTTATVTVFGTSAPANPTTPTQSTLPAETLVASPQSGSAPLSVTFSGIVTSANPGWCANGCSTELVFGDGSSSVTIPLPNTANTWQNYSVSHTYSAPGSYTATLYKGMQSAGRGASATASVSVTGNTSYGPFSVTPTPGNPLAISVSFTLPSACTGYSLAWGDTTSNITQTDASSSCGAAQVTQTFNHQYATAGSYSIVLKRGPGLSVTDTATVSISN